VTLACCAMGSMCGLGGVFRGLAVMSCLAVAVTACAATVPSASLNAVPRVAPSVSKPDAAKAAQHTRGTTAPAQTASRIPATSPSDTLPAAGNPSGDAAIPPAGQAVDTSRPDHVIGNGTPASCTSVAVVAAVAAGGVITFSCGPAPVTITMTATATVRNTSHLVVLDGGGLVTLSGGGARRILLSDTCAGTWSTGDCVNQPYPQIVVQNMTFEDGFDGTGQATCTANEPECWYGGVDGGGAIYAEGGQFKAVNSRFVDNSCYAYGPDLGGGALRVLAQYQNLPVYITSDTFTGGRCSNGGAMSSIGVQWDVINSVFTNNEAIGWGANPAAHGTPGGGSGGAIYTDGSQYNLSVTGTVMRNNSAREGGGGIFFVVDTGGGTLRIESSTLQNNPSGVFQNNPGIFDNVDGQDTQPVVVGSSIG
jgi:hypothetical protein